MMKPVDTLQRLVSSRARPATPRGSPTWRVPTAELASSAPGAPRRRWSRQLRSDTTAAGLLLLAHLDTVARGTLGNAVPGDGTWRTGPCADMKGGIVVMLEALRRGMPFGAAGQRAGHGGRGDRQPKQAARRTGAPRRGCAVLEPPVQDGTITTERSTARYSCGRRGAHAARRAGLRRPGRRTDAAALSCATANVVPCQRRPEWPVARQTSSPPRPGRGRRARRREQHLGEAIYGRGRCSAARG
jgi:hypothetical protein